MKSTTKKILRSVLTVIMPLSTLYAVSNSMKEQHSIVVDNFDNAQHREWIEEGETKVEPRTWIVKGSMHAAKGSPTLNLVVGSPNKRSYQTTARGGNILGIHSQFIYRGYNFFEITPITEDRVGFLLPGNVKQLSLWVWGSGYNYTIETQLEDYKGDVYVIPMGYLNFLGWRNLTINISAKYKKTKHNPWGEPLRFLRFVVRTAPSEFIEDFQLYLDDMQIVTEKDQTPYNGGELFDSERMNALRKKGQ